MGGVERSPIKKSWGEGVKMKKKSLGEGSVKYWKTWGGGGGGGGYLAKKTLGVG